MVVARGTTPCDFWNGQHAAYECVGTESRDSGNLTGRVPSQLRTVTGLAAGRALWVVPGTRGRPLDVRFPSTSVGPHGLELVVAATTEATGLPFEIEATLADAHASLRLEHQNQIVRVELRPAGRAAAELRLRFLATRGGRPRGLVFDGWPRAGR